MMDNCEEWAPAWTHPSVARSKQELNSNLLSALSLQRFKSSSYIISIAFIIEENSQPLHVLFFFFRLLWPDHFMCNLFWGLIYTTKLKDCCWRCVIWAHYQVPLDFRWCSESFTPPLLSVVVHLSNETKTLSLEDVLTSGWKQLIVLLLWIILATIRHHRQIFSYSDNKIWLKKKW